MELPEESGRASFFMDSLPEELLDNVLRFFSCKPASKNWGALVPLADIAPLYAVDIFASTLKRRFRTLCIARTIDCADEHRDYCWKLRSEPGVLWTNNIWAARDFVVAGGGKYLTALIIGAGMEKSGVDIACDFFDNCPHVTSLSVEGLASRWLMKFGGKITILEIATGSTVAISEYCTALRQLNLYLYKYKYPRGGRRDVDLWKTVTTAIGADLRSLIVPGKGYLSVEVIDTIRENCRRLETIHIPATIARNKYAILLLYLSYGAQLKYGYIDGMFDDKWLSTLVNACKNAKFHFNADFSYPSPAILNILAAQLDKIYLGGAPRNNHFTKEEENRWNNCVNLRSLDIRRCNLRTMREIMKVRKNNLRHLVVSMGKDGKRDDVKQIMDIAADGTGGVESFSYAGPKPTHKDAFDKFMENNNIHWSP